MSIDSSSDAHARWPHESVDQFYARLRERSDREDLVMFVNAGFASTRQGEFYTNRGEQSVSIEFLHQYVLANYRRLYARSLAAGINHFHQSLIIANLLSAGAPNDAADRAEEGELITAALRRLPANRAFGLLAALGRRRINNRRTRAIVKAYLMSRQEPTFDMVKYRTKYRAAVAHAHVRLADEHGSFLFRLKDQRRYQTALFEQYRQGHFSAQAIYGLPFTVAESLAEKHGVPRDVFLRKIEPKLTATERLRLQSSADRAGEVDWEIDLGRVPLTRLALYILSLPTKERCERGSELHEAMQRAAMRALERMPWRLGRVAAILDRSRSTAGSREKRNRPFAVALAASYLLRSAANEYRAIWTPTLTPPPAQDAWEFLNLPAGQTCLAEPLLDALEWRPDLVVIVSDGYENDPPRSVDQVAQVFRQRLGGASDPEIVHFNPVFDAYRFSPRTLGPTIPTVGLRDAEDAGTMFGFARFASGKGTLVELEEYLAARVRQMLESDEH